MAGTVTRRNGRQRPHIHPRKWKPTRVNALRIERGLTQAELADLSGVALRTVVRMCNGSACDMSNRRAVAGALGAPLLDLWPELTSDPSVLVVELRDLGIAGEDRNGKRNRTR